jgi:hypothetical protein
MHDRRHFDCGSGRLPTAVELGRLRPLDRLRNRMRRQYTEDDRHVGIQRRLPYAATRLCANVIEMRRVAANDRPETNHCIEPVRSRHCPRRQGNLERSRHPHHLDVVGLDPMFGQPRNAGIQQLTRDEPVELRDDRLDS